MVVSPDWSYANPPEAVTECVSRITLLQNAIFGTLIVQTHSQKLTENTVWIDSIPIK